MSTPLGSSQPNTPQLSDWHVRLREALDRYFDEGELEVICYDLLVDYENLSGANKTLKVTKLIEYMARSGRITELIDCCEKKRPNIPWSDLRVAAVNNPLIVHRKPDAGEIRNIPNQPPIDASSPRKLSRPIVIVAGVVVACLIILVGLIIYKTIPRSVVVDSMDGASGWLTYAHGQGASVRIDSTPGKTDNAVQVSYSIEKDKWVGISKELPPGLLSRTRAIGFSYKGSGAPNTIELKLIYAPDAQNREAFFGILRNHVTDTHDRWASLEIPYEEFSCWEGTGCSAGEALDLRKVRKIDFAISNKAGDVPGSGNVLLDNVLAIR